MHLSTYFDGTDSLIVNNFEPQNLLICIGIQESIIICKSCNMTIKGCLKFYKKYE